VNLEDGEPKADRVCELARTYGAALVALTIDEDGMAKTAQRKLEVARRIHDIVVKRHGLPPDALIFDPLTFTIGSGDEASRDAGVQTLEAIALIKRELPGVRTLLGLSNISFGLQAYARQVLNSVYLDEALKRGLDGAILNAAKIIPVHTLSAEEVEATLDLIYDRRRPATTDANGNEVSAYDPLFAFIERFAGRAGVAVEAADNEATVGIEDKLIQRIVRGKKVGIEPLLDEALGTYQPLQIINQILLEGMKVVGELFGAGKMQLPFVLQSAETMKAAVAHLEPKMERIAGADKGVMVLATVRGDVHDIGKNLVDIILTNNGYKVFNLGIKQPIETILEAAETHKADAIGLSGLLVKSTVVMKESLELMAQRGFTIPVVCGGAALNRAYVDGPLQDSYTTGEVYYGADAFSGLRLMDELTGQVASEARTLTGPGRKRFKKRVRTSTELAAEAEAQAAASAAGGASSGSVEAAREARHDELLRQYAKSDVNAAPPVKAPFFGAKVVQGAQLKLDELFPYINKRVLFRGQWQYRRGRRSESDYRSFIAQEVEPKFRTWCQRAIERAWLKPALVYGYFPCYSDRNDLVILQPDGETEAARVSFPRQPPALGSGRRLCIADFFRPAPERDVIALQVVTMGSVATEVANELFAQNKYDDYLHFHGLAVETAEALAEFWHRRVRQELGISGRDASTVDALVAQGYQGSRFSFGYPACPNLEDQRHIFELLKPDRIGLSLSEEWQIVPEQSTSALIVHHPEARYFNVA
jgi:5-methyltetrahydrofolate--homocysteine methyltransferase